MKDAIVAEHSEPQTEQIVSPIISAILPPENNGRLPNGRFGEGNQLSVGNNAGKGLAKTSCLVDEILDNETMADVNFALQNGRAEGLPLRKLAAYNRVKNYIYGDEATVDRIEGAVPKNVKHTGPTGGAIAVVTADCTELLVAALKGTT